LRSLNNQFIDSFRFIFGYEAIGYCRRSILQLIGLSLVSNVHQMPKKLVFFVIVRKFQNPMLRYWKINCEIWIYDSSTLLSG